MTDSPMRVSPQFADHLRRVDVAMATIVGSLAMLTGVGTWASAAPSRVSVTAFLVVTGLCVAAMGWTCWRARA